MFLLLLLLLLLLLFWKLFWTLWLWLLLLSPLPAALLLLLFFILFFLSLFFLFPFFFLSWVFLCLCSLLVLFSCCCSCSCGYLMWLPDVSWWFCLKGFCKCSGQAYTLARNMLSNATAKALSREASVCLSTSEEPKRSSKLWLKMNYNLRMNVSSLSPDHFC